MKPRIPFLTAVGFLTLSALAQSALAQTITATLLPNSNQMPGSAIDFSLFGDPTQFPYNIGGTGGQPTVLTNFGVTADDGGVTSNGGYGDTSTITSPAGTSVVTGDAYISYGTDPLLNLTLGNTANPSSTFDYSDFYVFAMYGNADVTHTYSRDASIALGGSAGTTTQIVADINTDSTMASYVEFHVTGYAKGDVLTLNALPAVDSYNRYLGGVSFAQSVVDVPEPLPFALVGLGAGLLVLVASLLRQGKLQAS